MVYTEALDVSSHYLSSSVLNWSGLHRCSLNRRSLVNRGNCCRVRQRISNGVKLRQRISSGERSSRVHGSLVLIGDASLLDHLPGCDIGLVGRDLLSVEDHRVLVQNLLLNTSEPETVSYKPNLSQVR